MNLHRAHVTIGQFVREDQRGFLPALGLPDQRAQLFVVELVDAENRHADQFVAVVTVEAHGGIIGVGNSVSLGVDQQHDRVVLAEHDTHRVLGFFGTACKPGGEPNAEQAAGEQQPAGNHWRRKDGERQYNENDHGKDWRAAR